MQYVIKSHYKAICILDGKIMVVIFMNNLPQEGAIKHLQDKSLHLKMDSAHYYLPETITLLTGYTPIQNLKS